MSSLHFQSVLLPEGWRSDVRVIVDEGRIADIATSVAAGRSEERHALALPGTANLHSHAFQRGMAGLAERRGHSDDSFWTWRETMYRFALSVTPDDVEALAAMVYAEMLEAGFTRVGEFHYLHNDHDGLPFQQRGEMAERIAAAASTAGIGLTLLPTFYAHSDFGGAAPKLEQRRFVNTVDSFGILIDESRRAVVSLTDGRVGVAAHSLRAVTPEQLSIVTSLAGGEPIHIHAAEQVREVDACLAWSGARPVEWLLDHAPVGRDWCLIHATHMNAAEATRLARSSAVIGLCPITEANLGDGIFDAVPYLTAGGAYGVGSDSNVLVDLAGELRQLEYSQRLARRARNVMAYDSRSIGRAMFEDAVAGGAQSLGAMAGLAVGAFADIVSIDCNHPDLVARSEDALLDAFVFSAKGSVIDCVWRAGEKVVTGGRHVRRPAIEKAFRGSMAGLRERAA